MGVFGKSLEGLDGGFAVQTHMQAGMVVMPQPSGKGSSQILLGGVAAQAIEFFFVGLVAAFDFAIESRGSRWDEAVLGIEAMAHGGEGMDFDGAV